MKKKLLLLIPTLMLALAACNNGGTNTSNPDPSKPEGTSQTSGGEASQSSEEYSDDPSRPEGANLRIDFYLDYNHYGKGIKGFGNEENKYHCAWWYFDRPFTKADIGLVDPTTAPDPYYPTFAGWSRHALVDETETKKEGSDEYLYMWNFGIDKVSEAEAVGGYIELFGIFVG